MDSTVNFVTVKENKNIGEIQKGYGDDSFKITDIEMTLIDCFDQPRYAGDFADVINAVADAKLTNNKLIIYTKAYDKDLDFTALDESFMLDQTLQNIAKTTEEYTGILFSVDKIKPLMFQNEPKGYQVYLKYWGAIHSKNPRPLPPIRWHTKIKLEISADEVLLLDTELLDIMHPYFDALDVQDQVKKLCDFKIKDKLLLVYIGNKAVA